jgi:peptide/nickel transport system substrate-binding protein
MNGGDYNNPEMNQLIAATYLPGTPSQIQTRMDAYQKFGADHLPGLWMPWIPQGYARVPGFNVHSDSIHGTVKYFNPVTNFMYANYWTISS